MFDSLIFMQDGAPPHHTANLHDWLNQNFPGRWMGRTSANLIAPLYWAPYSPDLTPCDFFLWGYIKSKVYRTQPESLEELQRRIEQVFAELPQEMVDRAIDAYVHRLEKVIEVGGSSVEL